MKFNVVVECTAEEAREFLGLPDLRPVQAAVMGSLQQRMLDATDALSPEGLLKTWLSLVPVGSEQYLKAFGALFAQGSADKPSS